MVKLVYKIWREKVILFLAKLVSMNIGIKINMENILNTINLDNLASCGRSNTLEVSHEYEARQSRWNTLYLDSDSYQALLSKAMNKLYYQTVSTITQKTKWVEVLENYAQGTRRDGIQRHSTYTRHISSILTNTTEWLNVRVKFGLGGVFLLYQMTIWAKMIDQQRSRGTKTRKDNSNDFYSIYLIELRLISSDISRKSRLFYSVSTFISYLCFLCFWWFEVPPEYHPDYIWQQWYEDNC